jgi:hypothetical protein
MILFPYAAPFRVRCQSVYLLSLKAPGAALLDEDPDRIARLALAGEVDDLVRSRAPVELAPLFPFD